MFLQIIKIVYLPLDLGIVNKALHPLSPTALERGAQPMDSAFLARRQNHDTLADLPSRQHKNNMYDKEYYVL